MSDSISPDQPIISKKRSISTIWLLPLVALMLGGWMVYHDWANRGQLVTISFITADGIVAGKTKIKVRSVEVGQVESVQLNYAQNNVLVKARIEPEATNLLAQNTRFWVVRPRVGAGGISGLGTLLSGAYIEMSPGDQQQQTKYFTGLEEPPIASESEPGLRLELFSDNAHSLSVGDTVIYRGFPVGRIEQVSFDTQSRQALYGLFIQAPYDQLVTQDSRFWNMSGINLNLSAEGVNLQTGTLDTLLTGGVTFDVIEGNNRGANAQDGDRFRLYPDFLSVKEQPYANFNEYMLLFDQSVRGLIPGAPVEFRGVRIGTVERISFKIAEGDSTTDPRIPVVIRLEPGRLGFDDSQQVLDNAHRHLSYWVEQGMRASLKSGNLITGNLYIDFDLYPEAEPAQITELNNYPVIPSISGGLEQLESKLLAVLSKVEQLPIEPMLNQANNAIATSEQAIQQLNDTLASVEELTRHKQTQSLPSEIQQTLKELRTAAKGINPDSRLYNELNQSLRSLQQTLDELQPLLKTLDDKPNALIFDAPKPADPIPGAQLND